MKINDQIRKQLQKEGYRIVGNHSAVKICRWTKKSLRNEGECYKSKFYGIDTNRCCQISCSLLNCQNKCIHCWRDLEYSYTSEIKNPDSANSIINGCIKAQRKLLEGFKILPETKHKTLSKVNMKKYEEAQEPTQFAISLTGEGTLYPKIGELISELRKRKKTSFLVTNGLFPEKIKELKKKKQLPTQIYVSVNASNEKLYNKFHRSSIKNAWKKLNETLEIFSKLYKKTRTVFRMNLVRNLNMEDKHIKEYAELIKKANPLFLEIKGYMAVGHARERLEYNRMPTYDEMKEFSKKLAKEVDLKILDEHEFSRVFVLGKNKKDLKIKRNEI
ncbi:4-demethylwyosine synthase TYW1 [Candidatus Pacearchaeota archaeon]|jgi:tRNA wybutosine-synthesizing protein 1|nr:4-demethylwyosine synthase TYW1 [Candidatus Pacearchaeota archaeon]|tara:strand:- start:886 stop:1878 length:993 start_codon:yes stop_codon:yes gene_type:complete